MIVYIVGAILIAVVLVISIIQFIKHITSSFNKGTGEHTGNEFANNELSDNWMSDDTAALHYSETNSSDYNEDKHYYFEIERDLVLIFTDEEI